MARVSNRMSSDRFITIIISYSQLISSQDFFPKPIRVARPLIVSRPTLSGGISAGSSALQLQVSKFWFSAAATYRIELEKFHIYEALIKSGQ